MSYDKCIRCGSCMKLCPIFDVVGEEQYSPRGKMYLLQVMDQIEQDKELAREFRKMLFQCTLCGRCEETCSSGVDLLKIWHQQRRKATEIAPEEFAYLNPLRDALANVKNIYGLAAEDRAIYWLDELEDDVPILGEKVYEKGMTADIMVFLGCLMSFRGSQIDVLRSLFQTLEKLDINYLVMGSEEFCCGHPLYLTGNEEGANELRKHNKKVIEGAKVKNVITCCPGCLIQLKNYHNLESVEALHHTEFFDRILHSIPKYNQQEPLSYHDPCELHRILGIKNEPRSLLNKMGLEYKEMELSCCGGGGLLRMTDPYLSEKIIELRTAREGVQNTTVLTACPSCREQLLSVNLKTKDIVELLSDSLEGGRS